GGGGGGVVVPAETLAHATAQVSDAQAGALWVNCLTVWVMLEEVLRLKAGEVLVQTAAGSQLGLAVMEHAAWRGLLLVNVVRRAEQARELRAAGPPPAAGGPRAHPGGAGRRAGRRGGGPPAARRGGGRGGGPGA